jgi:hypothetical protein
MRLFNILILLGLCFFPLLSYSKISLDAGDGKFHAGGQLRLRGEISDNLDFAVPVDRRGATGSRLRMDFGYELDFFEAFIQPQYSKVLGAPNVFGDPASGDLRDGLLSLHQGYVKIKWIDEAYLWMGRQEVAYGDHLFLGNVDWSQVGRAFDGFGGRRHFSEDLWLDLLYAIKFEGSSSGATTADQILTGFYVSKDWSSFVTDVYFFTELNSVLAVRSEKNILALGFRFKSDEDLDAIFRLETTGELITHHGSSVTDWAIQADGELGYQIHPLFGMSIEGAYAEKDYRQFYPTGHKWLGHQDFFSRRNIIDLVAHFKSKVMPPLLSLFLDFHYFMRATTVESAYKLNGKAYGTSGSAQDLGMEIDAYLKSQIHTHLKMQVGYSYFIPGQYMKDNIGSENPWLFYLQLQSDF